MSKHETTHYICDRCDKKLPTCNNNLDICTHISEEAFWKRLHVRVFVHSGVDNHGKEETADLCQDCASTLLKEAAKRIVNGERVTAGVESSHQKTWNGI